MRKLTLCLSLLFVLNGYGQVRENFDIASFTAPKGWKKVANSNVVSYTITNNADGGYCVIAVYKSAPSRGSIDKDFNNDWKELVSDRFKTNSTPETETQNRSNGWKVEAGASAIKTDEGDAVALLSVFSNGSTAMSVLTMLNNEKYLADADNLIASVTLNRTQTITSSPAQPPKESTSGKQEPDQRLIGKWNRTGASHPSYGDAASWGTAGYTTSRYEFKSDGSYVYTERSFWMLYKYILIVKESGRFAVNDRYLTITPEKSIIQTYTKKNNVDVLGTLVKSQNRPLEKVTYTHTLHYFSGIQEWNLVLQASRPTQRDGNFSSNNTFSNAWYFDKKYINNDLTSSTGN